MQLNLTGKRALVCGASQGIGKACAQELALLGCDVTILARHESTLAPALANLSGPGRHHTLAVDLMQINLLRNTIEESIQKHGPFHILVNNAGGPPGGPITDAKPEDFIRAFEMHLLANHTLAQLAIPGMKSNQYGRIINIISTSVKIPLPGLGVSNTIRGAVANWAKTLAGELATFGITVNNVLPGATETERLAGIIRTKAQKAGTSEDEMALHMRQEIPARRFGKPEEIAAMVAFLASPAASYVNGTSIAVDGGRTGCH